MKLRTAITALALTLICLGASACSQTDRKPSLPVRAEPEISSETTTPAQWQPKHDTEGQLKVQIEPANAKIDLVSLGEQNGILPVKVRVVDFGHNNGNPNNRKESYDAHLRLDRPRFISQVFTVPELNREVTQVLVRVSFEPAKIQKSFERAAHAYRMPVAYPGYIPRGYELERNEFRTRHQEGEGQSRGSWILVWARGESPVAWSDGASSINITFTSLTENQAPVTLSRWRQRKSLNNRGFLNRGPSLDKYRPIKLDDGIRAEISTSRAEFFVDGQLQNWQINFNNVPEVEAEKIVRGMQLIEYTENP